MVIVAIGWLYVALMMTVAEASNSNGTLLGALITFLFYGAVPVALVVYVMDAPRRRRAIKAKESAELAAAQAASSVTPDADRKTPADTIAPVREEA